MALFDLAKSLIEDVDKDKSEIVRSDSLVFLCGGKQSDGAGSAKSLRELILRSTPDRSKLGDMRVLLAETALQELPGTVFENLLDFEECIASIVGAVVVIVESPGSICELGAFIKTEEIVQKLIVVIKNSHANIQSFITVGAIKYFECRFKDRTLTYDWTVSDDDIVRAPTYALEKMLAELPAAAMKYPQNESLNLLLTGHQIYIVLSICHILRGAKFVEIKLLLVAFGIKISDIALHKYLNTLEICKFVSTIRNGPKLTLYVSLVGRMPLKIAFKKAVKNSDRNAMRRLETIKRCIEKEDKIRIEIFREHNNAT